MSRGRWLVVASCLLFVASCGTGPQQADLILLNGKIVTVDENMPETQALIHRFRFETVYKKMVV